MPLVKYRAVNRLGRPIVGTLLAENTSAAGDYLHSINITPVHCRYLQTSPLPILPGARGRNREQALIEFSSSLAELLRSGLPIDVCLREIEQHAAATTTRAIAAAVLEGVMQGYGLSQSLTSCGALFDSRYQGVVAAGERLGALGDSMDSLADSLIWQKDYRARLKSAIAYPAVTGLLLLCVLLFLVTSVVPSLAGFISEVGGRMPWHTSALLSLSELLADFGLILLAAALIFYLLQRCLCRCSISFCRYHSWCTLQIPVLGNFVITTELARFTHTFELLVRSRLDVLEALRISSGVISNQYLRESVSLTETQVREGIRLSDAMRSTGAFSAASLQKIALGELTGDLPASLWQVSQTAAKTSARVLNRFEKGLGPAMMCFVGAFVIWIVLSVIGPIYSAAIVAGTSL